jgi:hypothetical protein
VKILPHAASTAGFEAAIMTPPMIKAVNTDKIGTTREAQIPFLMKILGRIGRLAAADGWGSLSEVMASLSKVNLLTPRKAAWS